MVIQSHAHTQNLNNVLNQNVNMTKWKGVHNICYKHCRQLLMMLTASEWMKHNQIKLPWLIINVSYGSNFATIPDFFVSWWKKKWPLLRSYFGSWGHSLVAVAVVERWPLLRGLNKSQCMNCPPKKRGHCRAWLLPEVQLLQAGRTLLVYTAKNLTSFGSYELIKTQIASIFGKKLKFLNSFPLNIFFLAVRPK